MTSSGDEAGIAAATPAIRRRGDILLLGVRVIPSAAQTEIRGVYGDRLKVGVNAPPEGGKANARLIEALAGWLRVGTSQIRVESGHGGRDKVVAFSGMMENELCEKLTTILRGDGPTRRTAHGS